VNNITDALVCLQVCARWIPHSLTSYHRTVQEEACSDLFCYEADCESFLSSIITGDATWIHHFELQTKRQSAE
jgi:hypothetical protein